MCTIHTPIPPPSVDLSMFTPYKSSEYVTRYFCGRCGAHMFDCVKKEESEEQHYVATSLVDAPEQTWDFISHNHLEGTRDGGLAVWLPSVNDEPLKMWKEKATNDAAYKYSGDWRPPSLDFKAEGEGGGGVLGQKEDKLRARCHCGGVDFYIHRPQNEGVFKDLPESLIPEDKNRWYASNDVCTSCRLLSSCIITSWAFPLISHITLADGSPYPSHHAFGTIKVYQSSKDVTRTFCGTCGALVVYACEDRPQMVDVGVGLLEGGGARAEEWLEWRTSRVSWEEDCVWKGMLEGFKKRLKAWGDERDGRKVGS